MRHCRSTWQEFAELDTGNGSANRLEGTAYLGRRFRLGVERLMLRRPTGQPQVDDVLGLAKGLVAGRNAKRSLVAGPQQLRQPKAEHTQTAETNQLTAVDAITKTNGPIMDRQHDTSL